MNYEIHLKKYIYINLVCICDLDVLKYKIYKFGMKGDRNYIRILLRHEL